MNLGAHLLIQVYEGLIRQLEGLDGLQDGVPVAAVYVGHEALYAVHRVQRHRGLLLQAEQGPVQVVLLEVLHDQTDHAKRKTGDHNNVQVSCLDRQAATETCKVMFTVQGGFAARQLY